MKPRQEKTNITQTLCSLTGITVHALARKVGKPAELVKEWQAGEKSPTEEAMAILTEMLERTKNAKAADEPRETRPKLTSEVVCGDSLEYLSQIPDESVEMILSDIPYGIGLDDWDVLHSNTNSAYMGSSDAQKKAGAVFKKRRKPINGWSSEDRNIPREYYEWCLKWAPEWLRVLRPGGSAVVFAGRRFAHRCVTALEDSGFNLRDIIGWIRPNAVYRAQRLSIVYQKRGDLAEAKRWDGWRVGNLKPSFEPIIWCFKPYALTIADNMLDHQVGAYNLDAFERLSGRKDNFLEFGFAPREKGQHDAQKPVALLQTLIELCTILGQMVLDPFAGSGSTAVAAKACGRRYLTVEKNPVFCERTRQRLGEPLHE